MENLVESSRKAGTYLSSHLARKERGSPFVPYVLAIVTSINTEKACKILNSTTFNTEMMNDCLKAILLSPSYKLEYCKH